MNIQPVPVQVSSISAELTDAFEKDIPLEVVLLMAESTFLAIRKSLLSQAQNIIDGLTPHFSKHIFVPVLGALLAGAEGRHADAMQVLERLMKSSPRSDAITCVCAMLRKELGVPGWRTLAQRVIDRGEDADAIGMAEDLLACPAAHLDKMAAPSAKAALTGLRFA